MVPRSDRERYTELGHSRLHATAWSATRSAPLTPLFFEYTQIYIYGDIKHSLAQPRTLRDRDHSDKHFERDTLLCMIYLDSPSWFLRVRRIFLDTKQVLQCYVKTEQNAKV